MSTVPHTLPYQSGPWLILPRLSKPDRRIEGEEVDTLELTQSPRESGVERGDNLPISSEVECPSSAPQSLRDTRSRYVSTSRVRPARK